MGQLLRIGLMGNPGYCRSIMFSTFRVLPKNGLDGHYECSPEGQAVIIIALPYGSKPCIGVH